MKDIKYILKRVVIGVSIALILMLIKSNVFAYGMLGHTTSTGGIAYIPVYPDYQSKTFGNASSGYYNPWLLDYGQFTNTNTLQGQYFSVQADYDLAIRFNGSLPSPYQITSYINTIRNTLNAQNLRCGIGNYKEGYDATYAPSVPSFNLAIIQQDQLNFNIRITFVYSQQRLNGSYSNPNVSCWFERTPSDGLFAQINGVSGGYNGYPVYIGGTTYQANFYLSRDENTELLRDLVNQNNAIITNQVVINQNINEIKSSITDDSPPSDSDLSSALDAGNLPGGGPISNIITFPITLFNHVLSMLGLSCTDLTFPIPYVNQTATIQCVNVYFVAMGWATFYEIIGGLIGGIVLFYYLMYLYDRVNHLLFLEDKGDLKKYYS